MRVAVFLFNVNPTKTVTQPETSKLQIQSNWLFNSCSCNGLPIYLKNLKLFLRTVSVLRHASEQS